MSLYKKHVIVLGSARSGTSWLSENLAKPYRYRMLFEPEHDERTINGHLLTDQFFTDEYPASKKAVNYLTRIFKNRVDSDWIAQNSNRKYKRHLWPFIPKKFVIKFVRFNLSGQFLHDKFKIPIVHIIRDPFDLIQSQKRVSFPWLFDFSYFLDQPHLLELVKNEFNYDLTKIESKSDTEKLAVRWCIENVIPLQINAIPNDDYWVIKHEDLRKDANVYKDLCNKLGLEVVDNIEKEFKKPSSKAHPKSSVRGQNDKREFVNEQEAKLILDILKTFKQNLYHY
ncbi:MAG: sulfotransferase family protein [Nonlabens sp.]